MTKIVLVAFVSFGLKLNSLGLELEVNKGWPVTVINAGVAGY